LHIGFKLFEPSMIIINVFKRPEIENKICTFQSNYLKNFCRWKKNECFFFFKLMKTNNIDMDHISLYWLIFPIGKRDKVSPQLLASLKLFGKTVFLRQNWKLQTINFKLQTDSRVQTNFFVVLKLTFCRR